MKTFTNISLIALIIIGTCAASAEAGRRRGGFSRNRGGNGGHFQRSSSNRRNFSHHRNNHGNFNQHRSSQRHFTHQGGGFHRNSNRHNFHGGQHFTNRRNGGTSNFNRTGRGGGNVGTFGHEYAPKQPFRPETRTPFNPTGYERFPSSGRRQSQAPRPGSYQPRGQYNSGNERYTGTNNYGLQGWQ